MDIDHAHVVGERLVAMGEAGGQEVAEVAAGGEFDGVVLEEGSLTAHVIIVARAMGVPVLGRVRDVKMNIAEGDQLLLDASTESVFVRPTAAMEEAFDAKLAVSHKRRAAF